jgi:hypothetical protein
MSGLSLLTGPGGSAMVTDVVYASQELWSVIQTENAQVVQLNFGIIFTFGHCWNKIFRHHSRVHLLFRLRENRLIIQRIKACRTAKWRIRNNKNRIFYWGLIFILCYRQMACSRVLVSFAISTSHRRVCQPYCDTKSGPVGYSTYNVQCNGLMIVLSYLLTNRGPNRGRLGPCLKTHKYPTLLLFTNIFIFFVCFKWECFTNNRK